ncbi:MAG: 50S ribosomal protein L15 [Rhodomicrobium sp.]
MKLNDLRDNPGATKDRIRVGRGIGCGKGKTAGRGVKGQKARSGVAIKGFEGGQMPIHMRLPKRGFNKPNRLNFAHINLDRVQDAIDAGKLDAKSLIDASALIASGALRRERDGVRLLARGEVKAPLKFKVAGASEGAVKAVEAAGGSVEITIEREDRLAGDGKRAVRRRAAQAKRESRQPKPE